SISLSSQLFLSFHRTSTTYIYTFPYTTLFRSHRLGDRLRGGHLRLRGGGGKIERGRAWPEDGRRLRPRGRLLRPLRLHRDAGRRSEEHTSELQSLAYLVCRLLLEKKNSS